MLPSSCCRAGGPEQKCRQQELGSSFLGIPWASPGHPCTSRTGTRIKRMVRVAAPSTGSRTGGRSAALSEVPLVMGRAVVPAAWAQACPPPPPACCCQPVRGQTWEALGEAAAAPPQLPAHPGLTQGVKTSGVG